MLYNFVYNYSILYVRNTHFQYFEKTTNKLKIGIVLLIDKRYFGLN